MSRLELAKIQSLTFYQGEKTTYRRTSPLPQLVCVGKPCKLYQPQAVRCVNIGGTGTDVDWKCEADLPEALRFGKVEVSCEGWSRPGDPYVLKGSCSLEYRLVEVPGTLRNNQYGNYYRARFSEYDWGTIIFSVLWMAVVFFLAYNFILSFLRNRSASSQRPTTSRPRGPNNGGGSSGGWFPGDFQSQDPPPPYTKSEPASAGGWRPGFWTGALAGGLANNLWNRSRGTPQPATTRYDWERPAARPTSSSSFFGRSNRNEDRGEGTSNLGPTRRSTGFGGSTVR